MYKRLLRKPALSAMETLLRDVPQHWGTPDDDLDVLAALVATSRSQSILQFGTAYGLSAILLADLAAQNGADANVVCIDPSQAMNQCAQRYLDQAGLSGVATVREGDSLDPKLIAELAGTRWDLIYLDTTHQYVQTREEIRCLTPLCSDHTLFVFHDASQHAAETLDMDKQGGVARAIREWVLLHPRWQSFVFETRPFGQFGIGLMQLRSLV